MLEDPFPDEISEAIVDRVVDYTAEKPNELEEMVREVDKRHSSQRASFIEALETKMTCTSQAAIDRVANLEGSLKEFQTKLAGMASLAVEIQLQCSRQYVELLEKQVVEIRPCMDGIFRLEENTSVLRSLKEKLDSLETCTQGFQKWLDEKASESSEYRLQRENLRLEFLRNQALESQTFTERIVSLEKDATDIAHLVEENEVSGKLIPKYILKFRSTSDQVAQLKKEVQTYDSKLGAVSVALDNRRLQQLKEHTELIEEKMFHTQTNFDSMATGSAAELSNIATQAAKSEMIGKNSSRDHQIDDLVQSIRPIMLRLAGLERTEKQSDEMAMMRLTALEKNEALYNQMVMMCLVALERNEKQSGDMITIRLAALEEKNERQASRMLELERGNESFEREVTKSRQPIAE